MEPEQTETIAPTVEAAPSQDPVKVELEREQKKNVRSEAEKAAFSLRKNAERAKELGLNPEEILGIEKKELSPDSPVTVAMLEQIEKDREHKSALQLADNIPDENERELTKTYLKNRIVPSGNAQEDLRLARGLVNSVKTRQILEEQERKTTASSHSSGPGAPAKFERDPGELTAAELPFTKAPWNLTKEAIIKART